MPSADQIFSNQKDIGNNFNIDMQYPDLPIPYSPCRLSACMIGVCISGSAMLEIDLHPYDLVTNDIIACFPGQIVSCNQKTDDFRLAYFSFSNQLIDDILFRFPTAFISYLRECPHYHLPQDEKESLLTEYFSTINRKYSDTSNVCRGEIISNLLHNFYLDLYSKLVARNEIHKHQSQRKKQLLESFLGLLKTHPENREVAFYAAKLCITPKYLSIITKEITNSSAKELIDKFAITELKLQLKSSNIQLKELAAQLNYPCEAFLCKFFKKRTGLTPSNYRNPKNSKQ